MGHGRAENSHDTVADVFIDAPAVIVDQAVGGLEEARQQFVNFLGAEPLISAV